MPLDEEGAKWSCEPCIRGHRSSKCQHFDRLMMKVPKAGRPLAKCPHPKGSCSCQKLYAFMVRIPKGSTCLCRPVYKLPADSNDTPQHTPAPSATPISSPGSGRVQKNGRKQSQLQAAPENVAKGLESISDFESYQDAAGPSNHLSSYPPHNNCPNDSHPLALNFDPPKPSIPQNSVSSSGNAAHQRSSSSSAEAQPPMHDDGGASCDGKPNPALGIALQMDHKQGDSFMPQMNDIPYHKFSPAPQVQGWQDADPSTHGQFSKPFSTHQSQTQMSGHFPEYGPNTSSSASLGAQHQGSLDDIDFSQPHMHPLLSNSSQSFTYTPPQAFGDIPHDCSCGNDCQCLGCATHPFNNTTRQHVQEMGALVSLDGEEPNGYQNSAFHSQSGAGLQDYSFLGADNSNDFHQSMMQLYQGQASTPDLSNGYFSPTGHTSGQQLMAPSEYYTLEYPVGLPSACTDMTGSCQCNNDCNCVGCLTHGGHNGISLESAAADTMERSELEQPSASLSRIPVLDNLSVPSSSPHAIEP